MKQTVVWIGALIVGALLGLLRAEWIGLAANFVATVYTRLFQLLAVPTIALAVTTTLASLGRQQAARRIFGQTLGYTLLTTVVAAAVGLLLYVVIQPGNIPADVLAGQEASPMGGGLEGTTYRDHILSVVPNNMVQPFLSGNVLSILIIAFAVGLGLARLEESQPKTAVINLLLGLQQLLFLLIRWLIWTLPLGIVAFAAQLSSQLSAGVALDSIGKYVAVILAGNLVQFFVVLPTLLLLRGLNPVRVLGAMMPAVLMALFTKSSAATLPVTIDSAEQRLGVSSRVARFVLPICTTINMNGCAAFILVTSLFVMQNGGIGLSWTTMLLWLLVSVVAAVGNAGVPMGCFFLTLSLLSGIGAPIAVLGIILPIYTIIDMIETAENVWSDSCVAAAVEKDMT
jgi:Na+/H+-dicarboxylate symporter